MMNRMKNLRVITVFGVIATVVIAAAILLNLNVFNKVTSGTEPSATRNEELADIKALTREELDILIVEFVNHIRSGDYGTAFDMYDQEFADEAGITKDALQSGWEALSRSLGGFLREGEQTSVFDGSYYIYSVSADYENGGALTVIRIDPEGKIVDSQFTEGPLAIQNTANDLPEDVEEINLTIRKDGEYPLNAKLTYPTSVIGGNGTSLFVLAPSIYRHDMDYTTEYGKMYKALAYELAKAGFATMRYDNWSFSYPMKLDAEFSKTFTSDREVILDAVDAKVTAIQGKPRGLEFTKTYILGHRYSGMLVPSIMEDGMYDGGVILSSTPSTFVEVLYELYKTYGDSEEYLQAIREEYDRALGKAEIPDESRREDLRYKGLYGLNDDEIQIVNYFSFPAYYLKNFSPKPSSEYFRSLKKPLLILSVGKDADMPDPIGYRAYNSLIKDTGTENLVTLKYFPELNGCFAVNEPSEEPGVSPAIILDGRLLESIENWADSL